MKKIFVFLGLLIIVSISAFAASEEVQVYAHLYNNAPTMDSQLDILQFMMQARLAGAGEFYASALRNLVAGYNNIRRGDVTEKDAADDQAIILSRLLGAEKYSQASDDLWKVIDAFDNPMVKSEALMALGRIRSETYLPHVTRLLSNLNERATPDRLGGARIAFGAIISLEKYQQPVGYLPVFIASIPSAWYAGWVKEQAKKSLPLIAKDPTPYLMQIVQGGGNYNYETKYIALQTIEAVSVENENKAEVAVAALHEGWNARTNVQRDRLMLASMRKMALDMIGKYRPEDEAMYTTLDKSMRDGSDADEKLRAIKALASLRTDEGTKKLADYLDFFNTRMQRSGRLEREELRLVQELIRALGYTRNRNAATALNAVTALSYTNAIKNLAREALRQIPNS